jgi:predicted molibdopterin-dependent oxidoreductase YjgC
LEAAWHHSIAPVAGRDIQEAARDTALGVLYLAGEDPSGAWPRGRGCAEMVERAECVIVHEAFLTETARSAHVVFPVAILGEREGSLVGADGIRRALHRVLAPPANVPRDAQIFQELGRQLGVALPDGDALEAELTGIIQWPLPRPRARRLLAAPAPPIRERWIGMRLDASPQLFQSGTVTDHSPWLQELAPPVALRLSPNDANALGVCNGEPVRLAAGGRETLLRVRLDRSVRPGTVVTHWRVRREIGTSRLFHEGEPMRVEIRRST